MPDTPNTPDSALLADLEESLRQSFRAALDDDRTEVLAQGDRALDELVAHFPEMVRDLGGEALAVDTLAQSMFAAHPGKVITLAVAAIRRLANRQQ